ncbi:MAG: polyprenyl synthetase family protein [Methanomassiliicoccales archaeon]|nr:polyprenyl synthetase family protein [Methanomassiliicoccales archaeon]
MDVQKEALRIVKLIDKQLMSYLEDGKPEKLMKAVRHYPEAGGKKLRPVLAYVVAQAVRRQGKRAIPFGCALEIIHNFTLIHDDMIDEDPVRRGRPAVHVLFDIPTAVIAGDAMFARGYEVISETKTSPVILNRLYKLTSRTVWLIAEGQQMDFDFETAKTVSPDEYLEMVEKKTAVLFSCAAEGAAIIACGTPSQIWNMREYGRMLGIAFQIWDDVLGVTGDEKTLGKPIGSDIRNGKRTLIMVHALSQLEKRGNKRRKEALLAALGNENATQEEVTRAIDVLKQLGSIDYASKIAIDYAEKAKRSLRCLKNSREKEFLSSLVDFAVGRAH